MQEDEKPFSVPPSAAFRGRNSCTCWRVWRTLLKTSSNDILVIVKWVRNNLYESGSDLSEGHHSRTIPQRMNCQSAGPVFRHRFQPGAVKTHFHHQWYKTISSSNDAVCASLIKHAICKAAVYETLHHKICDAVYGVYLTVTNMFIPLAYRCWSYTELWTEPSTCYYGHIFC
jgi:hypothetical protein